MVALAACFACLVMAETKAFADEALPTDIIPELPATTVGPSQPVAQQPGAAQQTAAVPQTAVVQQPGAAQQTATAPQIPAVPVTAEEKPPSLCPSRCIVLMGDSRTVCLEECFSYNEDFHRVYFYTEAPKRGVYDAIYVNYEQDLALVFVGECRGYLGNGSFDYAAKRTKNYIKNNAFVNACDKYTYCNLYSFNDVILTNWKKKNSAANYMAKDTKLATTLKNPYLFIQFNAGPVSEDGNSFKNGKNNALISEFNLGLVPNDKVFVYWQKGCSFRYALNG